MRMRRLLAVASCAVAVVALGAGSAFAGEITGNGKPTRRLAGAHVREFASARSNGQNDLNPDQGGSPRECRTEGWAVSRRSGLRLCA